ncbi:hypothetical protein P691DRAFT_767771 [Macrolepiota fuliginosa MF-IS2]|uniref:Uncharacterized protein n=1 Tax=Macrolepiota fuliginosa MF-IS2 TaxID=1400762 RepID=A0A9P5WY11_9AGAR|nr:hypothetical protein P691DRAFT_767771 [Macrolepiota fuliginosa MF-IS2]
MPPPLPTAAASIPSAGPHGHASYAGAAAKNLNPAAPPFVHGPPRAPVAQPPAQAQQPISSKHLKQPFFAMRSPSCHQFYIEVPTIPHDTSLPSLVKSANTALTHAKSTLWVDSAHFSPHGITCATAHVPSSSRPHSLAGSSERTSASWHPDLSSRLWMFPISNMAPPSPSQMLKLMLNFSTP